MKIYGIKTCDSLKKAQAWLNAAGIQYEFHDYKLLGVELSLLEAWCLEHGWQKILNRSSTSFRALALSEQQKQNLDQQTAISLMHSCPTLIKRPILDLGSRTLVGFKPETYAEALVQSK